MTDNKQELIEQDRQWRTGWEGLVQLVGKERMEQPGRDGGWSFKDLLSDPDLIIRAKREHQAAVGAIPEHE
jgi:hypothetical protein